MKCGTWGFALPAANSSSIPTEMAAWKSRGGIGTRSRSPLESRLVREAWTMLAQQRETSALSLPVLGRVVGPGRDDHQSWGVSLVVKVPRKSGLRIETVNGPVSVEDVSGNIEVTARNGPVSLHRVGGDVRARVQNGPLSVVLAGKVWDGKGLDAEAMNGPVDLGLPDGYNAELETGTVNGPMDLQVPLTVTLQGRVKDRIHTTLGRGGPPVRVVTTNVPITIRRARS